MICENCGKYEATCHYSSNINGRISEQHLCGECAGETAWAGSMFRETSRMIDGMFDSFFSPRSMFSPFSGAFSTVAMPVMLRPVPVRKLSEAPLSDSISPKAEPAAQEADPELVKRREINALREEMRAAANAEEFEKAAELRDKLRELEK